jgi:DNA repair protein RadC
VISEGQALRLLSALRFSSEVTLEKASKDPISTPAAVERLLGDEIWRADRERLIVLLLNSKYRLVKQETVSIGSLNETLARPREVFKPAIAHSAHSIVIVHNHPSGDPSPSEADTRLTKRLTEASRLLQIPLLDHVIIGQRCDERPGYFSFREAGLIG